MGRFEPPSITVYPIRASGDTPPIRIIEGPQTQLNWPSHLFVDPERGELYVANDVGDSVLVFRTSDSGDVAPPADAGKAAATPASDCGCHLATQPRPPTHIAWFGFLALVFARVRRRGRGR